MIRSAIISTSLLFLLVSLSAQAQTATIDGTKTYQIIDGFGGQNGGPWSWASSPLNWNNLTSAQADALFSTSAGIGVSIYRTDNVDGTSSTLPPDLASMQEAVARGAQVELTLQSPPSSMKYGGTFGDGSAGASGSCLSTSNSTYAAYVVQLIQNLNSRSVPVAWVDVQNEPNSNNGTNSDGFGYCLWSGAALDSFVKVLGPALSAAGLSTKIILGSAYDYGNSPYYFDTCMSDSSCAPYVSVVSGHGYGYPDTPILYTPSGVHYWQGETADNNGSFDPSMTSALTMAQNMQAFLQTGEVSSYNWWELGYINNGGYCQDCQLIDQTFTPTKRYYAFGNFSKFVRPGMVMIGATSNPQSGVYVSAYKNSSTGAFAIVAVNTNGGSVSQPFSLNGLSATSVTPWITSSSLSLASQSPVSISGGSFTYSLPAASVTTFGGSGTDSGPGVPTGLKAVAE